MAGKMSAVGITGMLAYFPLGRGGAGLSSKGWQLDAQRGAQLQTCARLRNFAQPFHRRRQCWPIRRLLDLFQLLLVECSGFRDRGKTGRSIVETEGGAVNGACNLTEPEE
jgi:hypothetical protein